MRVCIVGESHSRARMAGVEYQLQLLADEFSRHADVEMVFIGRHVPTGAEAEASPYRLIRVGSDAGIRRRAVFFDAGDLRQALEQEKPDVIYQQGRLSYTAVCARYALKERIPFFFHVAHEFDLDHRWVTLKLSPNTPFDLIEYVTGMWGLKNSSHVIVQSARQGRLLEESLGIKPAAVIRNFQPLPDTLPAKPSGPLKIFWVANLKDFKRPWLYLELAESFAGRNDLEFIMAGRPASPRRLQPMMQRIRSSPHVKYVEELPIERVNELMSEASVHVNTSSFEGFPNTFLQAWARGAVVATLAVDPDEEGMEALGIGYCAGTMERLHAFIDELSHSPEKRNKIANTAFEFVHAQHSMHQATLLADLMLRATEESMAAKARPRIASGR
jgi:hypothetical protein